MEIKQEPLFSDRKDVAKDKIKALDELFALSAKYKKSDEFMKLLEFINKFPSLSPFNAFLVHMQDSNASIVLTPSKWKKYGRIANPLARPFIILVPFGPVEFVYNITDTEIIDSEVENTPSQLITPFETLGNLNPKVFGIVRNNATKEGILYAEAKMQIGGAGYATAARENKFNVTVNKDYNINDKFSTLIHELAHIYCGHLGSLKSSWWEARNGLSKDVKEIEAESISFLVCRRYGLTSTAVEYLSKFIKDQKPLPAISMETILTVSNHIEKMGAKGFKPKKIVQ